MISIRVCNPEEPKKTIRVQLISKDQSINGLCLENIVGTNLWQVNLSVPTTKQRIDIGVSFKFDSSWKLYDVKLYERNRELRTKISSFFAESRLFIQLVLDEKREEEYFSHCIYILRSANDGKELECISQIKALEEMSQGLNQKQREGILKKTIQTVQKGMQIRRANSAAFLCFLQQMKIPTLQLQYIMPMSLANKVFKQCLTTIWTPNLIQGVFETMENVYKSAFREEANFMSYCNYMYQFFGPKTSCYMLLKWKRENKTTTLLTYNPEYSRQTLKSLVEKVFHSFDENCDISEEIDFLTKLQVSLTLELQIELVKDLESRKISPLDMQLEILFSCYENKMNELSRKGEAVSILCEWDRITSFFLLSADKLRGKTKRCLFDSVDKISVAQLHDVGSSFQELFVDNTLFTDAGSKIQMMQKMATSSNEMFHSLMPACLIKWTLVDIPTADVESVVLSWFSHALKHHCRKKSKRDKASNSLLKLYSFINKIALHPLLRSESDLKRKLDKKSFEYLKEFEIIDIVNFVPEMTKLENGVTEEIFKDHVRELFKQGLQNQDLEKQSLFKHIKTREVDSQ